MKPGIIMSLHLFQSDDLRLLIAYESGQVILWGTADTLCAGKDDRMLAGFHTTTPADHPGVQGPRCKQDHRRPWRDEPCLLEGI